MGSWVVQSLLLSGALLGAVLSDSPEVRVAKNLIATSNKLLRDRNQTKTELPAIGWAFDPTLYKKGHLGMLDTLELQPDPKVVKFINSTGTVYNFSVTTSLKNLFLKLEFQVDPPYSGKSGNVTITVGKNTFLLEGQVLVKHDGTCFAVLKDSRVLKLVDSKAKYNPDEAFIYNIYQDVQDFIREFMESVINVTVRRETRTAFFKEKFNELTCAEVKSILKTNKPPAIVKPNAIKTTPKP